MTTWPKGLYFLVLIRVSVMNKALALQFFLRKRNKMSNWPDVKIFGFTVFWRFTFIIIQTFSFTFKDVLLRHAWILSLSQVLTTWKQFFVILWSSWVTDLLTENVLLWHSPSTEGVLLFIFICTAANVLTYMYIYFTDKEIRKMRG